jgi:hypothetical protein
MRIRYGGQAATIALVIGAVAMAWSPVMASIALGHPVFLVSPFTMLGGVIVLGGLLLLRGTTYVTVEDDMFVLHALVGPIKRRFHFTSLAEVELRRGKVWIGSRQIPIHKTQANPTDWRAFEQLLDDRSRR